jgi:hypothetical protein
MRRPPVVLAGGGDTQTPAATTPSAPPPAPPKAQDVGSFFTQIVDFLRNVVQEFLAMFGLGGMSLGNSAQSVGSKPTSPFSPPTSPAPTTPPTPSVPKHATAADLGFGPDCFIQGGKVVSMYDGSSQPLNPDQLATKEAADRLAKMLGGQVVDMSFHNVFNMTVPAYNIKVGDATLNAGLCIKELMTYGPTLGFQMIQSEIKRDNHGVVPPLTLPAGLTL